MGFFFKVIKLKGVSTFINIHMPNIQIMLFVLNACNLAFNDGVYYFILRWLYSFSVYF